MCAVMMQLVNFVLADKKRSIPKFFEDFTHPSIVRIVQVDGDYELSAPQFAKNAQFWVFDKHRQKRVVFRSMNDRYISISLDSPAKFHIVHRHTAGPTSTLKELFKNTRNVGDLKVALDDDPDLVLSNRPDLNNAVAYGELTAVAILEETCLVSQAMNESTLEPRLTLISTKAPLVLDSVVGIRKRSSSYFRQWTDALRQQQIHPSPALLTSPSPSDIVLLFGHDDGQHSSLLYIVSKDRCGTSNAQVTATTHLELRVNRSPGGGDTDDQPGAGVHQETQDKKLDVESLRRRFENSGPTREAEEDKRGTQRLGPPQAPASRAISERAVTALPPSVSQFRLKQKCRSLSKEDLLEAACQSMPLERIPLVQTHTRSLASGLDITDEACRLPSPPSTPCHDSNREEDAGYESIKVWSGGLSPHSVSVPTAMNATRTDSDAAAAAAAQNRVPRPPLPDPRTPSSDIQSKPKLYSHLGVGLRRKKKEKPPAPERYEKMKRASTEEHEYAEVMDLELSNRITEPEKRRKWKNVSEIPRDVDVSTFTVDEVARCLELLKLRKYARKFKERVVDGAVLVTVTESMLVDSFKMDQIDARKLVMFARENWRPSK